MHLHPERGQVLGEVHARPFVPLKTPARLIHFAFMTEAAHAAAEHARLSAFCRARGKPEPQPGARYHRVVLTDASLRWEQHSEFTTYTWEIAGGDAGPFQRPAATLTGPMRAMEQPGPLLVAADLHLLPGDRAPPDLETLFDPSSLAASSVDKDAAIAATDFQPCSDGFVRILVLDRGLTPPRAGALCQRLLEVETYRTLALLGLPEAQRIAPSVRAIEEALNRIAGAMTATEGLAADNDLLDELTALAASLEADAAVSGYRFGASRAYDGIVSQRLVAIGETVHEGRSTIAAFLNRRMAPAMRTCAMLEERQANLSRKLTRAANLLRTRVDVAIEKQNRDLLAAMNERTRLQLRLQQTVEGLSIAAVSYYVVGLIGYLLKGAKDAGAPIEPGLATALSVPLAVLAVAAVVLRIRRRHAEGG